MKKQNAETISVQEVIFGGLMAGTSLVALWSVVSLLVALLA